MEHFAARAPHGQCLAETAEELRHLYACFVRYVPGAAAITAMPNHVHVLHTRDVSEDIRRAMRSYARWRNARRKTTGPVWRTLKEPRDTDAVKRGIRYAALNPCRAELTSDPLTWPARSYRDNVGLSLFPSRRVQPGIPRHHQYVSADDSVDVQGTPLPIPLPAPTALQVAHAVARPVHLHAGRA